MYRYRAGYSHDLRCYRRAAIAVAAIASACAPIPATTTISPRAGGPSVLRAHIDSMIGKAEFRTAEWAVLAIDSRSNDTLYARNAAKLMIPASNMKLITASVALAQLGGDFRYTTTFSLHGNVLNGVLDGDLVVTGRGDPTLSDRIRGSARAALDTIADSLVAHGIHRITGHIYSGADNFPGAHVGSGWDWDDLDHAYGAGVDELLFNEGVGRVVVHTSNGDSLVKSAPAAEPSLDYLKELALALQSRGIRIDLGVAESVLPDDAVPLDTILVTHSIPLRAILPYFLKPSQNQIGEALMRTIGLVRTGVGTADSGIAVAHRQLSSWGIPRDGYELHDGSGMARADLISPETIVTLLTRMQSTPDFEAFYNALPIAGIDGTLAQRMRGTRAAGNAHAKTGSMQWVRSLSGYVTDADDNRIVFSILANKWTTSAVAVTATADSITAALAAYSNR